MEEGEQIDNTPFQVLVSPRPSFTRKHLLLPDMKVDKLEMTHETNFLEKMAFKAKKSIEFNQASKRKASITTDIPIKII